MALTDAEKQELLNEIKASSNDVSELETVDSLDGIVSLPAMKGEELVNAPVALLRKPAEEAAKRLIQLRQRQTRPPLQPRVRQRLPILQQNWLQVRLMRLILQRVKQMQ